MHLKMSRAPAAGTLFQTKVALPFSNSSVSQSFRQSKGNIIHIRAAIILWLCFNLICETPAKKLLQLKGNLLQIRSSSGVWRLAGCMTVNQSQSADRYKRFLTFNKLVLSKLIWLNKVLSRPTWKCALMGKISKWFKHGNVLYGAKIPPTIGSWKQYQISHNNILLM